MRQSKSLWRTSTAAVVLIAAGACADGGTGPARPASLAAVTPVEQTVVVASPARVPPAVRVSDERGRGLPGVEVAFAVTQGTGTVSASALTDADGVAVAADWVMGTEAQENALTASVPGLAPVVFRATAGPGEAVAMQREGPALRSSQAGTVQGDSILVRVVDRHGNGVPGVEVSFSTSHGTLSRERVTTGAQGWAGVYLPLPTHSGTIRVQASAQGFEPIRYHVWITPGPPARFVEGARDSLQVPQPFMIRTTRMGRPYPYPHATIIDAFGNKVPGYPVTFMPQPGDGVVVGGGTVVTNGYGYASVTWAPGQPGLNRMKVTAPGLDPVWFFMSVKHACGSVPYTLFSTITDYVHEFTACEFNNGEVYSVVVPVAQCVEFRLTVPSNLSAHIVPRDLSNRELAGASYRRQRADYYFHTETNHLVRIRLSAGTYRLSAGAWYWRFEYPGISEYEYRGWTLSSRPVSAAEDAQCAFPPS
jgi:hypothetical protein